MNFNDVPSEVWEMAMRVALERVALWKSSWGKKRQQEAEARRILKEAESWPLARCVDILPFVGQVPGHTSGLHDDGRLRFILVVLWMAPFPAQFVSLDFRCEMVVPDNPAQGSRIVTYTVRNRKVTEKKANGDPEYLDAGSIRTVDCELTPDSPVTVAELGETAPHSAQTRPGRKVDIKGMQITAHAPWKMVRDTENRPDFSFWVPRW